VNDSPIVKLKSVIDIVVDRLATKDYSDEESPDLKRLKDSLELAFVH
jgi:hypothetical protein